MFFQSQKKANGSELYEQVFYSLDLIEKDYFGLQYTDANHVQHWLDPTKAIKKQVKSKLVLIMCLSCANKGFFPQLDHLTRYVCESSSTRQSPTCLGRN